ncbi:MAG: hypothetical protein JJE48_11005 [Actinobacteria bacterium]|nr:hypothetical protein [Actinomycetota bacterium]
MEEERSGRATSYREDLGAVYKFLRSPLDGKYPRPMSNAGDWLAAVGIVLFIVAVFVLPWMRLRVDVFGSSVYSENFGLFVSPWAWGMVAVLVITVAGLWFVQTRGAVILGAGIYCLVFNIIFYIGAWQKVNAIIGDVVALVRGVPYFGGLLGEVVTEVSKRILHVNVSAGYYLFIPAGILLAAGGGVRLLASRGAGDDE